MTAARAGPAGQLALALALAVAGCGGGDGESPSRFDPFTKVRDRGAEHAERASARWERVATLAGTGTGTRRFTIADGAIQWRIRWRCEEGSLELARAVAATGRCPDRGEATAVSTGDLEVGVQASGSWRAVVEQQVDTPLREPPLAAMRAPGARVVAAGRFYRIERRGSGRALLHRLAGGRLALRLENFSTSANSDLFVWLSTAARPRTTAAAFHADHTVLRELKSTVGEQNYAIPAGVDAADIRSVVIWCAPVRIAYTAATLRPR